MDTRHKKRGRPAKIEDRRKAEYLDIRLESSEKQAFKDAAVLAGLDLSAWVRARLRSIARKELEVAGLPVAFQNGKAIHGGPTENAMTDHRECLTLAKFTRPSNIEVRFADRDFSLPVRLLDMPPGRIRWTTVTASPGGDSMTVEDIRGEVIPIDSATIRYLVDRDYAAERDAALKSIQLTRKELKKLARNSPPPAIWLKQPAVDLRRDSWK